MNSNVVKLHHGQVVQALEEVLALAKDGKLKSVVIAGHHNEGGIVTSWANAEPGQRQELIGHLQIDVIMGVVELHMEKE